VFGGMGSLTGSTLSAIFIGIVNMLLQAYAEVRLITYALVLIVVMIFRPQGLLGSKEFGLDKILGFKPPSFKKLRKENSR
jgi:branched-chain amino acid transport system permease protein